MVFTLLHALEAPRIWFLFLSMLTRGSLFFMWQYAYSFGHVIVFLFGNSLSLSAFAKGVLMAAK